MIRLDASRAEPLRGDRSIGRLAARRIGLLPGKPIDAFALSGRSGRLMHFGDRLLMGLGTALSIGLPQGLDDPVALGRAAGWLGSLVTDDRCASPSSGIVGFAAFPFERGEAASLAVPEITYCREPDGSEWVTFVSGEPPDDPAAARSRLLGWRPSSNDTAAVRDDLCLPLPGSSTAPEALRPGAPSGVRYLSSEHDFLETVGGALRAIEEGSVSKVVLARQVDVDFGMSPDLPGLLGRWHEREPSCTVFSLPTPHGQFFGASPELLVARRGRQVSSRPLAGTTARAGSGRRRDAGRKALGDGRKQPAQPDLRLLPGDLAASSKDVAEHRHVVEEIGRRLTPLCSTIVVPTVPDLVHLSTITHFGTSITGTLADRADRSLPTALDLVAVLHPTPAVGGVPRARAKQLIGEMEAVPRGQYAGAVGYLDGHGDGCWMVGIRACTLRGHTARLAAGVGIVAGSRPYAELAETELKLRAVYDALAPGPVASAIGS